MRSLPIHSLCFAGAALLAVIGSVCPAPAGVALEDFSGDGLLDVVTSPADANGGLRLYRNEGDGTFADLTEVLGLAGVTGGPRLVSLDANGDGREDLAVLRPGATPSLTLLVREDSGFRDATVSAGLAGEADVVVLTAADMDDDGHLDLFLGESGAAGGRLLRSRGDGTFQDVTESSGDRAGGPLQRCGVRPFLRRARCGSLRRGGRRTEPTLAKRRRRDVHGDGGRGRCGRAVESGEAFCLAADNDFHPDLIVTETAGGEGRLRVFHNIPDGGFQDATEDVGLADIGSARALRFADVVGDGQTDLIVTADAGTGCSRGGVARMWRRRWTGFRRRRRPRWPSVI